MVALRLFFFILFTFSDFFLIYILSNLVGEISRKATFIKAFKKKKKGENDSLIKKAIKRQTCIDRLLNA